MAALVEADKLKEQLAKASEQSEAEKLRQRLQKAEQELQDLRAHAPVLNLSDVGSSRGFQVPSISKRRRAGDNASVASVPSSCPPTG